MFVAAGPESMPPFTNAGIYRPAPEGISTVMDLIDPSLPGWGPGDRIAGFGFWFSGNLITFGAVGFMSPGTLFLIQGSRILPLIAAGDTLDGMTVVSLPIFFPHCTNDRVVLVPKFLEETVERPKLCLASLPLFQDGFESGETTAWSNTVP